MIPCTEPLPCMHFENGKNTGACLITPSTLEKQFERGKHGCDLI
jgi:hypothetical protein